MNQPLHPRRRPLHRSLAAAAVMSLAAGLTLVAPGQASADDPGVVVPDPAQRAFDVDVSAGLSTYLINTNGSYFAQGAAGLATGRARRDTVDPGDGSPYGPVQRESNDSRGYGAYYYGPGGATMPPVQGSFAQLFSSDVPLDPGPATASSGPRSAPDGTSVGPHGATAQLSDESYADGEVGAIDEPIFASSAQVEDFDLAPLDFGLASPLDALTQQGEASAEVRAEWFAVAGATDRRGIRTTSIGGTGTWLLLGDTVTVEVLETNTLTVEADGVAPVAVTYEGARVRVTGPDGSPTTYEAGDRASLSFTSPDHPDLRLDLSINEFFANNTGVTSPRGLSRAAMARYYRPGSGGSDTFLGAVPLGDANGAMTVPVGGVDSSEVPDSDGDGLTDFVESVQRTDPATADTDGGGESDGDEVARGSDPLVAGDDDSDGDGLTDVVEAQEGTDPDLADTDGDRLSDGQEVGYAGVTGTGTDPLDADTDGDFLRDGAEIGYGDVAGFGTDPLDADTDDDGLRDGPEVRGARNTAYANEPTDPLAADTDGDGLRDRLEIVGSTVAGELHRTDPNDAYTDADRLTDGVEVRGFTNVAFDRTFRSNPLSADSDDDGLRDRGEVTGQRNRRFDREPTHPLRVDTDGDGATDLTEIEARSNPADRRSTPDRP